MASRLVEPSRLAATALETLMSEDRDIGPGQLARLDFVDAVGTARAIS